MALNYLKRIAVDIIELEKEPLENIFIHYNDDDITNIYALIIGPKDTPYEHGFYYFSLTFPTNYPYSPPEIKYISQNRTRIHPNIYVNGKVCLSILGTWSGPGWTTIMDITNVLFTIQSLLDNDPLCNEPGYEKKTDTKMNLYKNYNMAIEYNTINSLIINRLKYDLGDYEIFRKYMIMHKNKNDSIILKKIKEKNNFKCNINLKVYYIDLDIDYERLIKRWNKYKFE